jgi:NodT family efflux transporter outer membrane factor (OMF) lipoprotein
MVTIGRNLALLAALLTLPLAGCMVGPDFKPPEPPTQTGYTPSGVPAMPDVAGEGGAQGFALDRKISGDWWTLFHSQPLNQLLDQAIAGNRTLVAARATLAQSREAVAQASGGLLPRVDLTASGIRQRLSYKAFDLNQPPKEFNLFAIGPSVSYALDIFGLTRRQIEQQAALAELQDYQLDAAYLTLTGNAVRQAITIAALRAQLQALDEIVADDQDNLKLVRDTMNAGTGTEIDVESAQSQMAIDRTLVPPLRQQLSAARHALAILIGRAPADWTPPDFDLAALTLPTELPVSLPSALVRQRPDLLAAEARLHAASAAVGVATASLFPNLTLTASMSQESPMLRSLFTSAGNIWSVGGNLAAPIFHGGELQAQKRGAEDAFKAEVATYEETVLESFGQVADVLDALAHDGELLVEERQALASADASLHLTRTSYNLGNASLLQILDAQRLYQQARLGVVRAEAQRYLDTAQLFVAMGGGWWEKVPAIEASEPSSAAAK